MCFCLFCCCCFFVEGGGVALQGRIQLSNCFAPSDFKEQSEILILIFTLSLFVLVTCVQCRLVSKE